MTYQEFVDELKLRAQKELGLFEICDKVFSRWVNTLFSRLSLGVLSHFCVDA